MSNPSLFFAIAGISMSFAGFAGLFLALRPHDTEWEKYCGRSAGSVPSRRAT